ncbi:MAG: GNAT family N-acetyltransferase [Burkholderiaceae bacterium]
MKYRAGRPSDARNIASLILSFQPLLTIEPSGAGAEQYLKSVSEHAEREYLESPRYRYLIAEDGQFFAGFIALRDNGHLFHLFVDFRYQRQGLAFRLWQEVRDEALTLGNSGVFTVNSSLNAIPVYRSFGFEPFAEVTSIHGISFLPMRLRTSTDA